MIETRPSNSVAQSKESHLKAILQYAAIPLTLVTSLLYMFGRVHYESYLSYWGLSESLFPLSKDLSVIAGFLSFLLYGLSLINSLTNVIWVLLVAIVLLLVSCYRPFAELMEGVTSSIGLKIDSFLRRNFIYSHARSKIMDALFVVANIIFVGCILILMFAILYLLIATKAKETAKKEYDKFISGVASNEPFTSRTVLYVKNDAKGFDQYSGHLIKTSTTHAALYSKVSGVSIFQLSTVSQIVIRENKTKVK